MSVFVLSASAASGAQSSVFGFSVARKYKSVRPFSIFRHGDSCFCVRSEGILGRERETSEAC